MKRQTGRIQEEGNGREKGGRYEEIQGEGNIEGYERCLGIKGDREWERKANRRERKCKRKTET